MNWKTLPYNHSERGWQKNIKSIFDPDAKISWLQFIAEMVIYNRSTYIKTFPDIPKGAGWSNAIAGQVRQLVQQASALASYFPHIEDEPLVIVAFKNVFRNNRVLKIGQYRKTRVKKNGSLNITKDEQDVVKAIEVELNRLIKQRDSLKTIINKSLEEKPKDIKDIKFGNNPTSTSKKSVSSLISLENKIKKA